MDLRKMVTNETCRVAGYAMRRMGADLPRGCGDVSLRYVLTLAAAQKNGTGKLTPAQAEVIARWVPSAAQLRAFWDAYDKAEG